MNKLNSKRVPLWIIILVGPVFLLWAALAEAEESFEEVTLTTESGAFFQAYVAGPEDSTAGILLVHDWFGVSDFYLESVEKLGSLGFRVIAIDYYGGNAATSHQDAFALMQQMDAALTSEKVLAGLTALKQDGRKIATFGFSLGTEYAYRGALGDGDVTAVVIWYGFMPTREEDVSPLGADMLAVLGSLDGPAADQGAAFSKLMDSHGKSAELYIYPQAHHAFAQPLFNAGKTYHPEGAAAAWAITLDFLRRKLQ